MVDDVDGGMDGVSDVDGVIVVSVLLLFAGLMIYPDK